jgi:hypothetical protein
VKNYSEYKAILAAVAASVTAAKEKENAEQRRGKLEWMSSASHAMADKEKLQAEVTRLRQENEGLRLRLHTEDTL